MINGSPTYAGRTWQGHKIEGLLMNSRMVQGIFDDLNPASRNLFVYPDTGVWDPDRNTSEFIAAMPEWRAHGLVAFTINLQGYSVHGQPWINSAVTPGGKLRQDYMARLARSKNGLRLLVGTSYGGGFIPLPNVVKASDFLLIHGNGVSDPQKIAEMVRQTRQVEGFRPMPILFNEDDHFDINRPFNNMIAAISEYAGWGYFDYRMEGEGFDEGYQSVPVNWGISSPRKKGFFDLLKGLTGEK